jgi:pimeloyl-ACP methyl ester carboxylesterase
MQTRNVRSASHLTVHTHTTNGRTVSYREYGSGDHSIILIHGVGSQASTWDTIGRRLADAHFHTIAVNLPGHGLADSGTRGHGCDTTYTLTELADAISRVIDHTGTKRATIIGHSLGGGVALQLLQQAQHQISSIVLVSSGGLGKEAGLWLRLLSLPGASLVLASIGNRASVATLRHVNVVLTSVGVHAGWLTPDSLSEISRVFGSKNARKAFFGTLRNVVNIRGQRRFATTELVAARHLPLTIIWGEADTTLPVRHAQHITRYLAHARIRILPRTGHDPHLEQPEEFLQYVLTHLQHADR